MNVRKVVKTIAALGAGLTMLGATLFGATAADLSEFPRPLFINEDGAFNGLLVVGATAAGSDVVGMNAITAAVQAQAYKLVATTSTSSATVSVDDGVNLHSGTTEIYYGDAINVQTSTITSSDLSVLDASKFEDNDGTTYEYEQTIDVGNATFEFSDSSSDLDDPSLLLQGEEISAATDKAWYVYKVDFQTAVNFTASDVISEEIELFGKSYTVSSESTADKIVLLGGATSVSVSSGETVDVDFQGEKITIELLGTESGTTASLKINGEFKEVTESTTFTLGGIDYFVKTVADFSGTENSGLVEIQVGAKKLILDDTQEVALGDESSDQLDGTYVALTSDNANKAEAVDTIAVYIGAEDSDVDHLLAGESFTDQAFGAVELLFDSVNYDVMSDDRKEIEFKRADNDDFAVVFADKNGNSKEIEFAHTTSLALQDKNAYDIHISEGEQVTDEEYFFLNSGSYTELMKLKKIDIDSTNDANAKIDFEDQFTGTDYTLEFSDATFTHTVNDTKTINGQTYYFMAEDGADNTWNTADDYVVVTTSSYNAPAADNWQIYQYLETVAGKNFRVGFLETLNLTVAQGTAYTFVTPTGTATAITMNEALTNTSANLTVSTSSELYYQLDYNNGTELNVTPGIGSTDITVPSVFLIEEENDADSDAQNAVVLRAATSGAYVDMHTTPLFSGTNSGGVSYDDSDYTGYVDEFGTFVYVDTSDTNQDTLSVYYPTTQLYANIFIASTGAETTTSTTTGYSKEPVQIPSSANVLDTEVDNAFAQNMIVVGGPCVNSVASALMGSPENCAEGFVAGKAMIKLYDDTMGMDAGKVALFVAGYNAEDTRNAANVLANYADYTSELTGMEVEVSGTASSGVVVSVPTVTTTTEAPVVEETETTE